MLCPETPTIKRSSSHKKIIISSPSQELFRFLTLPNPRANEDPRDRLHILTPKNKTRSMSNSLEKVQHQSTLKKKPSALSRVTFIRKSQPWNKKNGEFRSVKLTLSDKFESKCGSWKEERSGMMAGNCRLNFTFGLNPSANWLQV